MIGAAAAWLIAQGVPAKAARPLLIGAGVLALLAAVVTLWQCSVADEVGQRESEQRAANAEQAREADATAAATARDDDKRNRDERGELEGLPNGEPTPLSASERAFLRCVRLQQSARAERKPVPAC